MGDDLTPREREALALLAEGLITVAIAKRMGCSAQTVKNHLDNAYEKLGLEDDGIHNQRVQAAQWVWTSAHAPSLTFEIRRERV